MHRRFLVVSPHNTVRMLRRAERNRTHSTKRPVASDEMEYGAASDWADQSEAVLNLC